MRAGLALAILIGTTLPALAGSGSDHRHSRPSRRAHHHQRHRRLLRRRRGRLGPRQGRACAAHHLWRPLRRSRAAMSAIIIRAPATCRATGVSRSSRPPTASCRSRRRAIINHGRRNPCRSRRARVPLNPPPVIVAPQTAAATACRRISPRPQGFRATGNRRSFHTRSTPTKTDPQERVMRQTDFRIGSGDRRDDRGAAPAMACGLFDTCSPCTPCVAA